MDISNTHLFKALLETFIPSFSRSMEVLHYTKADNISQHLFSLLKAQEVDKMKISPTCCSRYVRKLNQAFSPLFINFPLKVEQDTRCASGALSLDL